jgi:hypothetical protein
MFIAKNTVAPAPSRKRRVSLETRWGSVTRGPQSLGVQRDAAEPLQVVADAVAVELEAALELRRTGADPKALRRVLRRIEELLDESQALGGERRHRPGPLDASRTTLQTLRSKGRRPAVRKARPPHCRPPRGRRALDPGADAMTRMNPRRDSARRRHVAIGSRLANSGLGGWGDCRPGTDRGARVGLRHGEISSGNTRELDAGEGSEGFAMN